MCGGRREAFSSSFRCIAASKTSFSERFAGSFSSLLDGFGCSRQDGVLSEKEFKRFFECFLRYAFFDVVQKAKSPKKAKAEAVQQAWTRTIGFG